MTRINVLLFLYVASVVVANWVTSEFGLVPAGFGLLVPAGTYAAGMAFGLRDLLQDAAGIRLVMAAMVVASAVSFVVSDPTIAVASAVAFLVAEAADLAVYTPLRKRGRRRALLVSNAVGAAVDTVLFLWIAGFPLTVDSVAGQLLVKVVWCSLLVLAVREVHDRVSRQRQLGIGA